MLSPSQSKHIDVCLQYPYRSKTLYVYIFPEVCVCAYMKWCLLLSAFLYRRPPSTPPPPSLLHGCRECRGAGRAGSVLQQTPCLFSLTFLRCSPKQESPTTLPSLILTHVRPVCTNVIWKYVYERVCWEILSVSACRFMSDKSIITIIRCSLVVFTCVSAGSHYTWWQIAFVNRPRPRWASRWKKNQSGGLAGLSCLTTLRVYLPFTSH